MENYLEIKDLSFSIKNEIILNDISFNIKTRVILFVYWVHLELVKQQF